MNKKQGQKNRRKRRPAGSRSRSRKRQERQITRRTLRFFAMVAAGLVMLVIVFGVTQSTNKIHRPLSPSVKSYEETILKLSKEYGIEAYVPLVSAVMMQESHGRGNDPMQASEGNYNKRFPQKPHGITDPRYSIECGIRQLADDLEMAGCKGPTDIEGISLAIQGYNFGDGYIIWALEKDGKYTEDNAAEFAEMMAGKNGMTGYGDVHYVKHVLRYYPYS